MYNSYIPYMSTYYKSISDAKITLPNNRWSNCHAGHARLAKVKIISASVVPTAHPVSYLDGSTAWGPV